MTLHQTAFGPTPGPRPSCEGALGGIKGLSEPLRLVRKVLVGTELLMTSLSAPCWWIQDYNVVDLVLRVENDALETRLIHYLIDLPKVLT